MRTYASVFCLELLLFYEETGIDVEVEKESFLLVRKSLVLILEMFENILPIRGFSLFQVE